MKKSINSGRAGRSPPPDQTSPNDVQSKEQLNIVNSGRRVSEGRQADFLGVSDA